MIKRLGVLLVFVIAVHLMFTTSARVGALSVTPLRQSLQLKPGQTTPKSLIVYNTSKATQTIKVHATSFNTVDKQYNYEFGAPPDLSGWIQFIQDEAVVEAGRQHTFMYNVAVPNEAEPGGKYIAIFASVNSKSPDPKQTKNVIEQVGSLIYLTVAGNATKLGSIVNFSTPVLSFSNPNTWNLQIQNKGNTHFESKDRFLISRWFGWKPTIKNESHLILPGTIRELTGKYSLGMWPGIYKIQANVGLGDNPTAIMTKWMVYLPPLTTIMLAIALSIVIGWLNKKLRRHKMPKG